MLQASGFAKPYSVLQVSHGEHGSPKSTRRDPDRLLYWGGKQPQPQGWWRLHSGDARVVDVPKRKYLEAVWGLSKTVSATDRTAVGEAR
ncbi:hypothetical protein Tdes44962_MAKER02608 [Teratosphaeria destructans]|uniref:Uncharacterized protein n=1 Tax=Teratosphaeria destructans TaxID=418781 RepID=A0A9W7STH2_9PEZI|nr:hypothetical protein Tdes44962_MAKER02608 [Teratosphaeria destructans]